MHRLQRLCLLSEALIKSTAVSDIAVCLVYSVEDFYMKERAIIVVTMENAE